MNLFKMEAGRNLQEHASCIGTEHTSHLFKQLPYLKHLPPGIKQADQPVNALFIFNVHIFNARNSVNQSDFSGLGFIY